MTRAQGIDVSWWQGAMDWQKAKANGASFAYLKASQQVEDVSFKRNRDGAKAAGILWGAYHYLDWRKSELEQAKLFCDLLRNDPGDLPPMADFEMDPMPPDAQGRLWNFLQIVERELGVLPGIYCGYYSWTENGTPNQGWARYPLWEAWWTKYDWFVRVPKPWKAWTFWQNSEKGDGWAYGAQSKQIDLDFYNGTVEELMSKYGGEPPVIVRCPTCGQVIQNGGTP